MTPARANGTDKMARFGIQEQNAMRFPSFLLSLAFLAVATLAAFAQPQERYALLVGVGEYPNLGDDLQLHGPPNDVALMQAYLTGVADFTDENVIRLTDRGPRQPRRANILAALDELQGRLTAGDFVLLYFAGHGSRQPADSGSAEELDGYDEIFLPADVGAWRRTTRGVENAIVDDEIAEFVNAYRQLGVDVWAVFDSCHSGTMTRGVGDAAARTRKVRPQDLGVPETSGEGNENSDTPAFLDISGSASPSELGSLVSFFASHAAEETPEMPLPRGAEEADQQVYGLFTYSLLNALRRHPNVSYSQLAELVTTEYASIPHMRSTPQFYGTDMNQAVFGGGERPSVFRATLAPNEGTELAVRAGRLRGFDVGAGVSIHGGPADDEALGIGSVSRATLAESTVNVEWEPGASEQAEQGVSVWVRLVHPAYTPTVFISQLETRHDADNRQLTVVVESLRKEDLPLVEFRRNDSDADYFVAFFEEKFWLLRPDQQLPCYAQRVSDDARRNCESVRIPQQLFWSAPEEAEVLVRRAARARNLVELQAFMNAPESLALDVQIERGSAVMSLDETDRLLRAGDELFVSMANVGVGDVWDVFFFYVDSNLGIQALQRLGSSARVQAGDSARRSLGTISNSTTGTESLVIVAERAVDGREANYQFLAQEAYERLGAKGAPASPLQKVLEAVWAGEGLEARSLTQPSEGAHMRVFTWSVEP